MFLVAIWGICLVETSEACRLWNQGIHTLIMDTQRANHPLVVERWLRKQFNNLLTSGQEKSVFQMERESFFVSIFLLYNFGEMTKSFAIGSVQSFSLDFQLSCTILSIFRVAMKHMKPFVQTSLQYKVTSRALQEITEVFEK